MKKLIGIFAIAALACQLSHGASVDFDVSVASNQTAYSPALSIHGVIDRIEFEKAAQGPQCDVVVASFASDGTTIIDTFASIQNWAEGGALVTDVVRPRLIGTTTAGVDIAGVQSNLTNAPSAATTVLMAGYDAPVVGGNVKVKLTNDATGSNITATVKGRIFYTPIGK
jgi:hypothetical protein